MRWLTCRMRFNDATVSREHARLHVDGEQAMVEDLGGRNGTQINGKPLAGPSPLVDGDELRIGNRVLSIAITSDEMFDDVPTYGARAEDTDETAPIEIGDFCYLGSEVRVAPGAKLPDECILGIGAVLTGEIKEPRSLVAGVPAKVVRALDEKGLARIRRKTRGDIPDDFYER